MNPSPERSLAPERPLAERVETHDFGAGRLLALTTPVRGVVTLCGSLATYPDLATAEDVVQDLTVALLDKGTEARDRFAVAEFLEDRGIQLQFYSEPLRVGFSARLLGEHLEAFVPLLAEQLRTPLLADAELGKARARLEASLQRSQESTASQASAALARRLYGRAHPNHVRPFGETLRYLGEVEAEAVQAFHAEHLGARDFVVVAVGDVDGAVLAATLAQAFAGWATPAAAGSFEAGAAPEAPGTTRVFIADRHNLDVRLGHALSLRRPDPDYHALYLANHVLGGNFSARLMATVRDEMGLTYGIGSRLSGVGADHDGHWQVGVTLSRDNLARGLEATLAQVAAFVRGGITEAELREKQTTLTGTFQVRLATTGGLATALLEATELGFGVAYLDAYPDAIRALTLDEVNAAVERHFSAEALHRAVAGTLPEETA